LYIEQELRQKGFKYFIGVDEAGRGPLAGPVVACAVFLDNLKSLPRKLAESKTLSLQRRTFFYNRITKNFKYATSIVDHEVIDKLNIYVASHHAFMLCLSALLEKFEIDVEVTAIIIDGPSFIFRDKFSNVFCFIGADRRSKACQIASIVAKVTRDRIMEEYAKIYPEYGFHIHKGYATQLHKERIRKYGPCRIHRRSFKLG